MEKKHAAWLDKAVRVVGLTLSGVMAFALAAGVASSMLRMYLGRKQQGGSGGSVAPPQERRAEMKTDEASDVLEWLRSELVMLGGYYEASVREGAIEAYMFLVANIGDISRPSDVPIGKLLSAIRIGVFHAGTRLMTAGRDHFGQLTERDDPR